MYAIGVPIGSARPHGAADPQFAFDIIEERTKIGSQALKPCMFAPQGIRAPPPLNIV
jgi:hypothetical protein